MEVVIFNLCVIGGVVVLALFVLGLCYVAVLAGIEIAGSVGAGGLAAYIAFIGLVLACWACACLVATTDD
ncbi:hypothetical protein AAVH_24536 [Aphelenchoides avenae]|nr:hypothetical protein AAVH_24536 [Aphelenchus avenae]